MRLEIPEQKALVFELSIPIAWGDMDALGHVNNVMYFRYMESARVEWMRSINAQPNAEGEGPVIVNTFCNFYQAMVYPGQVSARLYVANPGRSSFDTFVTLSHSDAPEVICAAGGATVVWTDLPAQRAAALPQQLRLRLGFSG